MYHRLSPLSLLVIVLCTFFAVNAYAGTTGAEFQAIYDLISGWATGYLGRIIALATFLVGLGVTIVRQSLVPVIAGLATAIVVAFGPSVIEGIATGTF